MCYIPIENHQSDSYEHNHIRRTAGKDFFGLHSSTMQNEKKPKLNKKKHDPNPSSENLMVNTSSVSSPSSDEPVAESSLRRPRASTIANDFKLKKKPKSNFLNRFRRVRGTKSALLSPHDTTSDEDETEDMFSAHRRQSSVPITRGSSMSMLRLRRGSKHASRHSFSANTMPRPLRTLSNNDASFIEEEEKQSTETFHDKENPQELEREEEEEQATLEILVEQPGEVSQSCPQLPPSIIATPQNHDSHQSLKEQLPAYQAYQMNTELENPTSASTDQTRYYENPTGPKDPTGNQPYWPPGNPLGPEKIRRMDSNTSEFFGRRWENRNLIAVDSEDEHSEDDANSVIEEAMKEHPHQWKYSKKRQLLDSAGVWLVRLVHHLLIAGVIMLPGMICWYNVEDRCNILNTPLYYFSLWLAIVVISHFLGSLAVTLVMLIIKHIPYLGVQFLYYINNIGNPFTWFFVCLTAFSSWTTIFWTTPAARPFFDDPRWGNSGYFGSFVICVLVTGVAFFARALFMRLIAIRFHRTAYFKRIKSSLLAEYVVLSIMVPKDKKKKVNRGLPFNFLGVSRPGSLVDMSMAGEEQKKSSSTNLILSSEFFTKLLPVGSGAEGSLLYTLPVTQSELTDKRPFSNHKLATYVEFIKHNHFSFSHGIFGHIVHRRLDPENRDIVPEEDKSSLTNMQAARVLSAYIFDNLKRPEAETITVHDFEQSMDHEMAERAFSLFDGSWDGAITEKNICTTLLSILRERNALKTALNDAELSISRLGSAVTGITCCILIIAYFIIFKSDPGQVLMSVSSFLLATAFAIGSSIKNLLESIIFLFITHPFDIGDRVVIPDKEKKAVVYTVTKLSLLTSELKRYDNAIVYFNNANLAKKPIINLRRSPDQIDIITLEMNFQTPTRVLREFEARISTYLERHSYNYHKKFEVEYKEVQNVNKMLVRIWIQHRSNFHNMRRFRERHGRLIIRFKKICEQLCIDYELPQQRVVYEGMPDVWPDEVNTVDDYAFGTDPLAQAAYGVTPREMPRLRKQSAISNSSAVHNR